MGSWDFLPPSDGRSGVWGSAGSGLQLAQISPAPSRLQLQAHITVPLRQISFMRCF